MMIRSRRLAAVALVALLSAVGAAAPASAKSPSDVAREHYMEGTKLFDLTQYEDAIREFEAAYRAKPDPVFLYNIAQAHRLAGHLDKAVRFYRNYLRVQPNSPQRVEIEGRIADIEQALKTQQRQLVAPPLTTIAPGETMKPTPDTTTPEPTPTPTPTTPTADAQPATPPPATAAAATPSPATTDTGSRGGTLKIAGIVVAAAGVALLGVGIGLGVDSLAARDQYTHPQPGQLYDKGLETRANTNDIIAISAGAAGVVAVAAGVVLFVRGRAASRDAAPTALLVPTVSPTHAGAALAVTF